MHSMTATIQYYFKGHIPSGKTRQIMGRNGHYSKWQNCQYVKANIQKQAIIKKEKKDFSWHKTYVKIYTFEIAIGVCLLLAMIES